MANHKVISVIIALFFTNYSLFKSSNAAAIAISWGDNYYEDSLKSTCATGNFKYISINLHAHCNPNIRYNCRSIGIEIKACQSLGVKVFLSLGSRYFLSARNDDPRQFASYLLHTYLSGNAPVSSRPFGDAILDGIDFDSPYGSSWYWGVVARSLKDADDDIFLTASPSCQYPDYTLGPVIDAGLFNSISVKFFDNPRCQYDGYYGAGAQNMLNSWSIWKESNTKEVFIGLPAAPEATRRGGYIPPNVLVDDVLPYTKFTPNYGGIMLWSRYYDMTSGYSNAIAGLVINGTSIIATS
ncbi:acidic endochitinase-like [Momordica charantia]|uniref:Acidic endochitinase-like n=1 Tax=Momordica charantia TaxID=3673 RepID=A0A6J1DVP2_MOMCH|nr:acidic endochitinase-like [Momordica charantia]